VRFFPVLLLCVLPALAAGDAAVKAREGEINHWIEYYQRDRTPQPARPVVQEKQDSLSKRSGGEAPDRETKR